MCIHVCEKEKREGGRKGERGRERGREARAGAREIEKRCYEPLPVANLVWHVFIVLHPSYLKPLHLLFCSVRFTIHDMCSEDRSGDKICGVHLYIVQQVCTSSHHSSGTKTCCRFRLAFLIEPKSLSLGR